MKTFNDLLFVLGRYETTIDTLDFTTAFSTEQYVPKGTFESNITEVFF